MADSLDRLIAEEKAKVKTKPVVDLEKEPEWEEGGRKFRLHEFQLVAWNTLKRIILLIAGHQSGKSHLGAYWLFREIQRTVTVDGENFYLIVGPNVELLKKSAIPKFHKLVKEYAEFKKVDRCWVFTPQGCRKLFGFEADVRVFVGYATKPESLEAATYKAIWPDEAGQQDFLKDSWNALLRRAGKHGARICVTTTPYTIEGWLKDLVDDVLSGNRDDCEFINFPTIANPEYPKAEIERLKKEYSDHEYKLFVLGEFSTPQGAVYDCFSKEKNVVKPFQIPDHWPRYLGMDFGTKNTAAVFLTEDPDTLDLFVYGTYCSGDRTVREHANELKRKGLSLYSKDGRKNADFDVSVGGTWSEGEWRTDFIVAGLSIVRPPVKELDVGISRVYRQFKTRRLFIFDTCDKLIADIQSYRRETDKRGEVTEKIYRKETYHRLDSLRVLVAMLRQSIGIMEATERTFTESRAENEPYIDKDDPPAAMVGGLRRLA